MIESNALFIKDPTIKNPFLLFEENAHVIELQVQKIEKEKQ